MYIISSHLLSLIPIFLLISCVVLQVFCRVLVTSHVMHVVSLEIESLNFAKVTTLLIDSLLICCMKLSSTFPVISFTSEGVLLTCLSLFSPPVAGSYRVTELLSPIFALPRGEAARRTW